jgi:hypothetical protein
LLLNFKFLFTFVQNVVARMRWRRLPYHTQLSASKRMEDKDPDGPCARLQHHFFLFSIPQNIQLIPEPQPLLDHIERINRRAFKRPSQCHHFGEFRRESEVIRHISQARVLDTPVCLKILVEKLTVLKCKNLVDSLSAEVDAARIETIYYPAIIHGKILPCPEIILDGQTSNIRARTADGRTQIAEHRISVAIQKQDT